MGSFPACLCVSTVVWGNVSIMSNIWSSVGVSLALMSSCFNVVCPSVMNLGEGMCNLLKSCRMIALSILNCGGGGHLRMGLCTNGLTCFCVCRCLCLFVYETDFKALLMKCSGYPRFFSLSLKRKIVDSYVSWVVFVRMYRMASPVMIALCSFLEWFDSKCKYWYKF